MPSLSSHSLIRLLCYARHHVQVLPFIFQRCFRESVPCLRFLDMTYTSTAPGLSLSMSLQLPLPLASTHQTPTESFDSLRS